jgi:hypothetical protein
MRFTVLAIFAASAAAFAIVQARSPVPYGEIGPTFLISASRYVYPGNYTAMRSIDFRNFTIHVGGDPKGVRFNDGRWKSKDPLGYDEVVLDKVYYLTSPDSSVEFALLSLEEDSAGGSSSQEDIHQVLELSNHKLRIVEEMNADLHYGGPYFQHAFDEATKTLVLHSAHYLHGDAHCCVSAMDVVTLKWNGSRFVQTSIDTELTDNGKREGKKLMQ